MIGAIRRGVDASGIPVEFSKGEWGPGQHEINLRYAPALEMADRHVIYKQAAKEIAAAAGTALTFMAKFDESLAGSSLHVHLSLWNAQGEPVFGGDEALPGVAGARLRRSSAASSAGCSRTRASSRSSSRRTRTPTSATAPAPSRRPGSPGATTTAPPASAWSATGPRCASSAGSPAPTPTRTSPTRRCSPRGSTASSARLDPGPGFSGDAYASKELPQVPHSLAEAAAELERSEFARSVFGADVVEHYLHFTRTEERAVDARVSDVERARYFERI